MSLCEAWNFLIIARQASLRPGSVQNQVRKLSSIFAPCRNTGAARGARSAAWARLPVAAADATAAVAAAPSLMNSRRLIVFLLFEGLEIIGSDIENLHLRKLVLRTGRNHAHGFRTAQSKTGHESHWV